MRSLNLHSNYKHIHAIDAGIYVLGVDQDGPKWNHEVIWYLLSNGFPLASDRIFIKKDDLKNWVEVLASSEISS
jgi:hypothetical protein